MRIPELKPEDPSRVSQLTDLVVERVNASTDKSWGSKKQKIRDVLVGQSVGTDIRSKMFAAIQAEMSRRSAARRKAAAATKRLSEKIAS